VDDIALPSLLPDAVTYPRCHVVALSLVVSGKIEAVVRILDVLILERGDYEHEDEGDDGRDVLVHESTLLRQGIRLCTSMCIATKRTTKRVTIPYTTRLSILP
jgi:hypothetical protein